MLARDYFEQVRLAAREVRTARATLERLRSEEGLRAQRYDRPRTQPSTVNASMETTERRIDFEMSIQRGRLEDAQRMLDDAYLVLYGRDGTGGIAHLLGARHADVMLHYYCHGETWKEVSEILMLSRATVLRTRDEALDMVDAYGIAHLKEGTGTAIH